MLHVITGPPCSGKTTFANSSKSDGDIVIDLDALCFALGGSFHGCTGNVRTVAKAARDAAIDAAIRINADAWVIHSNPSAAYMSAYERFNAEFHALDPGIETCKRRAREGNRPKGTLSAIDNWYASQKKKAGVRARASRKW